MATNYFPNPDYTQGHVTEQMQHDARGRVITENLQVSATGGTLTFPSLPAYQQALTYNDADQVTTAQTSSTPSGVGYTTTRVYDSTTTPNVATVSYTPQALPGTITFLANSTTSIASESLSYDGDLRPSGTTATWQSGSGSSGNFFVQNLSYDPASNVTSLSTTQAAVPGTNNSGGSETQNFCYDEQNRLVWAGNSGTQPGAGNGTCGSGTLSNTLSNASYSNSFVYTHLGQLWQGPLNGGSTQKQYLYCSSSQPHQLTGLYGTSATCSTKSGQVYGRSYDAWGNVTSRSITNGTSLLNYALSYDGLDHLVRWNDMQTTANQEWYMYDASGNRVLKRSATGTGTSNTKITLYPFGLEEHTYDGAGTLQFSKYYYSLGGHLVGKSDGSATSFFVTDALGSVLANFSAKVSSAALLGNQTYGPYGSTQYQKGTLGTSKGFTGQYNDALTTLDYYGSRYYDPAVSVFLSADTVLGNIQGMNPYAYVGGNPETYSDPTGSRPTTPLEPPPPLWPFLIPWLGVGFLFYTSWLIWNAPELHPHPAPNTPQPAPAPTPTPNTGCCALDVAFQDSVYGTVISFQPHSSPPPTQTGSSGGGIIPPIPVSAPGAPCSFTSDTRVRTQQGEKAIGKLHVGDKVLAYNPKTHKMEQEPILHVWINHDTDLVDLTLTTTTAAGHGKAATKMSETIHTNQKHPFFTLEKGFLPVGQIKLRMHVLRADGTYGMVTGWKVVPGTQVMYNLEVAQDHTFTVGDGQWVVHNKCGPEDYQQLRDNLARAGRPVESGQQPHHVIPCALENHGLVQATDGLFDKNAAYNGRPLWSRNYPDQALEAGEPYHYFHTRYTARVRGLMDSELARLSNAGTLTPDEAFTSLLNIIDFLNIDINAQGLAGVLNGAACLIE